MNMLETIEIKDRKEPHEVETINISCNNEEQDY